MMGFRCCVAAIVSLFVAGAVDPAHAQGGYPSKPVRLIVGFGPGSAADITGRALSGRLSQILGQQVVVESRPGAGSNLAAEYVARSPKDGYTLFLGAAPNVANAAINPNLSYNLITEIGRAHV